PLPLFSVPVSVSFFSSIIRRPPSPTLFPYTTLFRSQCAFHAAIFATSPPGYQADPAPLSCVHDPSMRGRLHRRRRRRRPRIEGRSEEHTSELQSRVDLVCRLLLEKKKNNNT